MQMRRVEYFIDKHRVVKNSTKVQGETKMVHFYEVICLIGLDH